MQSETTVTRGELARRPSSGSMHTEVTTPQMIEVFDAELLQTFVQQVVEGVEARLAVDVFHPIAQGHEFRNLGAPGRVPLERPDVADLRHQADRIGQLAVVRREQDGAR